MSFNNREISCVRCKAYLFEDDDVVFCPECGAPHHRECYNALQHCALEHHHGTEQQYFTPKTENQIKKQDNKEQTKNSSKTVCNMCGEHYDSQMPVCPKCFFANHARIKGFEDFNFLGGLTEDYELDENVTVNDAKRFVFTNTHRYLQKFVILNKKNKISWNWMAFLFPSAWLLSRKMFKKGIVAGVLSIVSTLLGIPFVQAINNLGMINVTTYVDLAKEIYSLLPNINFSVLFVAIIGVILDLLNRLFFGMFGDYIYKKHTISGIKEIKTQSNDIDLDFRKKGGVNLIFFFLGVFAVRNIPTIIAMFI